MSESTGRSLFGPVVLAGLASAAVLTVASARDWFELGSGTKIGFMVPEDQLRADMPLALALSLVLLAGWGVVLVTGPRARRVVLLLAALASLGVLACLVAAPFTVPDQIRTALGGDEAGTGIDPTPAYLVSCVAAPVALAIVVVAWRLAPRWPVMSSRYDAPGGSTSVGADAELPAEDLADRELWKALDEGRDPTQG